MLKSKFYFNVAVAFVSLLFPSSRAIYPRRERKTDQESELLRENTNYRLLHTEVDYPTLHSW